MHALLSGSFMIISNKTCVPRRLCVLLSPVTVSPLSREPVMGTRYSGDPENGSDAICRFVDDWG